MSFPYNAYFLAVVTALAASGLSLPLWRRFCLRTGIVDDPGERKIHDQPTPLAGGLAVLTGFLVPALMGALLLWGLYQSRILHEGGAIISARPFVPGPKDAAFLLSYGLRMRGVEFGCILLGALGMLGVGLADDKWELRPSAKFAAQFLVALLVAASGARITLFVPSVVFHYAITILWILTLINAFNFMDNMNGLCAGLGCVAAWMFALVAAADQQYLVALIAFLTVGALLGFLPANFPRARVFLGDSGSHLIGYLLAVLAILPHFYTARHAHRLAVFIPLVVLAVPLADMVWVVLLRWRIGQPFYQGDTNHLSHRLVRAGMSRTAAVLVIWLVAAVIGAVGLLVL